MELPILCNGKVQWDQCSTLYAKLTLYDFYSLQSSHNVRLEFNR